MKYFYLIMVVMLFVLMSCTVVDEDGDEVLSIGEPEVKEADSIHGVNGVKYISPSVNDPRDSSTLNQLTYKLPYNDSGRLLMRLENLQGFTDGIIVDESHRVYLTIGIQNNSILEADTSLRICPLHKNWMMLATWDYAHPFPGNGRWDRPGGDIVESNCISGRQLYLQDGSEFYQNNSFKDLVFFDVTDWYIRYSGNKENFGFALLNDAHEITIRGDADGSNGPRLRWKVVL
jgi:hypothetical protein